jgi:hypothetical protein
MASGKAAFYLNFPLRARARRRRPCGAELLKVNGMIEAYVLPNGMDAKRS